MAKKATKCERCGLPAELEIVQDGFEDTPKLFTLVRTYSGFCEKAYEPITAQEMHRLTKLPLSGWPR